MRALVTMEGTEWMLWKERKGKGKGKKKKERKKELVFQIFLYFSALFLPLLLFPG